MQVTIYTSPGCSYCSKTKKLLNRAGLDYTTYEVGHEGFSVSDVEIMFPEASGFPVIVVDDKMLPGGIMDLAKLLLKEGLVTAS